MNPLAKGPKKGTKSSAFQVQIGGRKHRLRVPPAPGKGGTAPIEVTSMSPAMVQRLFWRAGFGPTPADMAAWTGKPLAEAVEYLLSTGPQQFTGTAATKGDGNNGSAAIPLDPFGDDDDLVANWVDRMIRGTNPLIERLIFFWHRHWANSRAEVSPPQLLSVQQRTFERYSDFSGEGAGRTFVDMAQEISVDPSMLRYLTGESNFKGAPNENYARELMELFGLGILNASGQPNYTEEDVKQLSKALSGWQINDADPNNPSSFFTESRWYNGPKAALGGFGNWKTPDAVAQVLSQPAHARFIVLKIWHEFIVGDPDQATIDALTKVYLDNNKQLKPLLKAILTSPALFASLDEPNMIKPPVVYVVGAFRALGLGITPKTYPLLSGYLGSMGQVPWFPPTVAGWEGGLSWLNTNTALARFDFAAALCGAQPIEDIVGETAQAAFARAYAAVGSPWLAPGTQQSLTDFAASASFKNNRKARQIALRALMLAGPDGQVM